MSVIKALPNGICLQIVTSFYYPARITMSLTIVLGAFILASYKLLVIGK